LLGSRLRDLRSVLRYLRGRTDLDVKRVALWGDSFAATNAPDRNLAVPLEVDEFPNQAEPLGGLLALLGGLFEDDVRAVSARAGLAGYRTLLQSPFCYVPHDALVPDVFAAGDLCDLAAAIAPRALHLEGLVDGLNCPVATDVVVRTYEPARAAYRTAKADSRLDLGKDGTAERWLLDRVRAE